MLPIQDIQTAQHIAVIAKNKSFANASAIYSYLLTQHKKVSLVRAEKIHTNLSFLPWFEKLKDTMPTSVDMSIDVSSETLEYFDFFQKNSQKINKKMATALYAGLLNRYENFTTDESDGTIFALARELIELGAEHKSCNKNIIHSVGLSVFRLKALLFAKMILVDEARELRVFICDEDLKKSGASLEDAESIIKELLSMVHVRRVVLIKSDEKNKILKEETRFEK